MKLRSLTTLSLILGLLLTQASFGSNQCSDIFGSKPSKYIPKEIARAAKKLLAYEATVGKHILEREYVLDPFLVTLLAKEHVLFIGPPGNAKTTLSKLLMNNIVDAKSGEVSFYSMQMNKEITLSDTHGSINFKDLSAGAVRRNYEEGLLTGQ